MCLMEGGFGKQPNQANKTRDYWRSLATSITRAYCKVCSSCLGRREVLSLFLFCVFLLQNWELLDFCWITSRLVMVLCYCLLVLMCHPTNPWGVKPTEHQQKSEACLQYAFIDWRNVCWECYQQTAIIIQMKTVLVSLIRWWVLQ